MLPVEKAIGEKLRNDGPCCFDEVVTGLPNFRARPPKEGKNFKTPIPKEWQDAVTATGKERVLMDDGLLDLIWPDKQ